jgi:large subunit ribosomal protein L25
MAIVPLVGRVRPKRGKGPARQARRDGLIPAVMYGAGEEPVAVTIPLSDFEIAVKNREGNIIFALKLDGAEGQTAILREIQRDPVSHDILHLDFHHISLTEKVTVEVTIHLTGIADGVKNGGGILETITRSIEVECLPTDIPPSIDVDVSALGVGDSIHVRDLSVPGIEILTDPDITITTVVPPTKAEEAPAAVEGTLGAPTTEPELISKGKAEEGAEAEAKPKAKA